MEFRRLLSGNSNYDIRIPSGDYIISGELVIDRPMHICGGGLNDTRLRFDLNSQECGIRILSSMVEISNLTIEVNARSKPGLHDGEFGTAITIGRYFYEKPVGDAVVRHVRLHDLAIRRTEGSFDANSLMGLGAIADVKVSRVTIERGLLGVGFHWGGVGKSVKDISGPSYHPNHIVVEDIDIKNSEEGFWFSSCHDVEIADVRIDGAKILFRLLPGDNGIRLASREDRAKILRNIRVKNIVGTNICAPLFVVRITGWGKSEIDQAETSLPYHNVLIESIDVHTVPASIPKYGAFFFDRCENVNWKGLSVKGDIPALLLNFDRANNVHLRELKTSGKVSFVENQARNCSVNETSLSRATSGG